jgi:hypothetical protein
VPYKGLRIEHQTACETAKFSIVMMIMMMMMAVVVVI